MRLRPPPFSLIRTHSQTETAPKAPGSGGFGAFADGQRRCNRDKITGTDQKSLLGTFDSQTVEVFRGIQGAFIEGFRAIRPDRPKQRNGGETPEWIYTHAVRLSPVEYILDDPGR